MDIEELVEVLNRINSERKNPVDPDVLKQVIALVVMNPLEEDRAKCQDQIYLIMSQSVGGQTK